MLETRDLCKTYKPKKGVPVQAVDHVSLRFPERGMVFLLGKSGSGKSTMLNLLGGLDQYDGGEIIIKGISSKDFSQQRFDSYRNTYVGFIFQEYNVLDEFTVGANIGLALQLQGKNADDAVINDILRAVDLEGFGNRKPNELSGGQKQRVAIARALVKSPEIIMADEPTGALDSNTGRQVLDTLKKLSAEKLVIIVSHDREYAEAYADRIIELADGKVIRDVEAVHETEDSGEKALVYRSSSIEIPADYHLTEEDRIQINEYLDKLRSGASLMLPSAAQRFADTDESRIPQQDGSKFSLIKSRLPMKYAFRIGCSSLKHKRFRLVMTILLSVVAFTLFALVDTFSSYDHIRACTDSLIDSDVNYVSVNRSEKHGSGLNEYWSTYGLKFSEAQMQELSEKTGVKVTGIFIPKNANFNFRSQFDYNKVKPEKASFYPGLTHFCGFAEITADSIKDAGYELIAGVLPDPLKNEIAVSKALCASFIKGGYRAPDADDQEMYDDIGIDPEAIAEQETNSGKKYETIRTEKDMIGKTFRLMDIDYTVTGIVDTKLDLSRYDRLLEDSTHLETSEEVINYFLQSEFRISTQYSLTGCAMVGKGKVAKLLENEPNNVEFIDGPSIRSFGDAGRDYSTYIGVYPNFGATLSRVPESEILWLNGKQEKLGEKEVIVSLDNIDSEEFAPLIYREENDTLTDEELIKRIREILETRDFTLNYDTENPETGDYEWHEEQGYQVVGLIRSGSDYADTMILPDALAEKFLTNLDGIYDSAVGAMPDSRSGIEKFLQFCYPTDENVTERYELNHAVSYELDTVSTAVKVLAKVFLYIGIGFAIFAALLMSNFITTSIHYKRQEIGILRAIGSRSADVFRIFFSESFVIAMINFVLSSALCFGVVTLINYCLRRYAGILITVLHFGVRQVLLLIAISVGIAAVASFLPVHKIASKKPIDAIRGH